MVHLYCSRLHELFEIDPDAAPLYDLEMLEEWTEDVELRSEVNTR